MSLHTSLISELLRVARAVALLSVDACFWFLFQNYCALDDHNPLVKCVFFKIHSLLGSLCSSAPLCQQLNDSFLEV